MEHVQQLRAKMRKHERWIASPEKEEVVAGGVSTRTLPEPGKRAVLRRLVFLAGQAGVTPADGSARGTRSGLKATVNAAVLISMADRHRARLARMTTLPESELAGSFRLLALAFAIADTRQPDPHSPMPPRHAPVSPAAELQIGQIGTRQTTTLPSD